MPTRHWDIFCTVIDNLGDIATCWRLAQILHHEHGQHVRLFVDELNALKTLVPAAQSTAQQTLYGIEVRQWTESFPDTQPAQVVIETFGCTLPASYVRAMQATPPLAWINLEYMSCEDWVDNIHNHDSILAHGLKKRFIIPSLRAHGGGLLRESDLLRRRDDFLSHPAQQRAWCEQWNIPLPIGGANSLKLSLFGYENPQFAPFLHDLSQAPQPITAYLPQSRLLNSLREYLHNPDLSAGDTYQHGSLTLHILPFLPQAEYDRLLWLCDINFVRGEESLTRAIWAGKPFIWHIYPTDDHAHQVKLNAFLEVYTEHGEDEHLQHLRAWMQQWNGLPSATEVDICSGLNMLIQHQEWHQRRSTELAQRPNLCQQLMDFVAFVPATG
ncbi:MAG: hypothetical protein B7Y40_01950 [Gammaproteobacteria bacterium 28-57-27]|nr:MAG: hypothetical protein B7Y40_01950 [Gammaproteobacteria bacterium 28-57-27]